MVSQILKQNEPVRSSYRQESFDMIWCIQEANTYIATKAFFGNILEICKSQNWHTMLHQVCHHNFSFRSYYLCGRGNKMCNDSETDP